VYVSTKKVTVGTNLIIDAFSVKVALQAKSNRRLVYGELILDFLSHEQTIKKKVHS
jgi:hypothetical protein